MKNQKKSFRGSEGMGGGSGRRVAGVRVDVNE